MCFSTACLQPWGWRLITESLQRWWTLCFFRSPFPSSLPFKPFTLRWITLQLVCAASSRADVMNNSPYTLDSLSFVSGHVTDPDSTVSKTCSPVIGLFFNSLSNILGREHCGFMVVRSVACCSWILYPGYSRGVPGSWVQVSSADPGAQGFLEMLQAQCVTG